MLHTGTSTDTNYQCGCRCYEGGGEIWRSIVACLFFSMLIFSFFLSCVLVAKQAFYQAAVVFLLLPIIIVSFWCALCNL